MKNKLKGVLGVGLILVMALSLTAIMAVPVSAGENEWSSPAVPASEGSDGDWFWDSTIADGPGPIAQAIDGTLYVYAQTGSPLKYNLFKSDDEGRSWSKTDYAKDLDGEGAIVDIACSSLDEDILYVADTAHVYKTDDGGDTFDTVGSKTLTAEEITSVDVGYLDDDSPYVFMGTTGTPGHVYYYNEEDYGAGWQDLEIGGYDVFGLGVSPDFADDSLVAALGGFNFGFVGTTAGSDWSDTTSVSGSYSAKLVFRDAHTAVDFTPVPGTTIADLAAADAADFGFWYYLIGEQRGPQLELKFTSGADFVDVTFMLQTNAVLDTWTPVNLASTFGNIGTWDGTASTSNANLAAALIGLDGTWELTNVRVELYQDYSGMPDRDCYIDDVTIDGFTYGLPSSMVATNQGDVGVWDYLPLDTAITDGSDPVFPEDFDEDDAPDLFVGVAGLGNGSVYRVDVDGGETYRLGDEDSDIIADVISLDVVGDYGATCLIAGTVTGTDNKVIYSTDDGDSWDDASKDPSGDGATYVVMDEDFADSGIAWAACDGVDGAVSLTVDGGDLYNQISMIDTGITAISDVSFSRNYGIDETRFLLTTDASVDSLWRDDGNNWERVFTSTLTTPALGEIDKVMVSINFPKDETVYVADSTDPKLYRSTDGGNDWDDLSSNPEAFTAWLVLDADTVVVGTDDQEVWITGNHGRRAWDDYAVDDAGTIVSFSVSPNFMNDDTLLLGDDSGQIFISEELGEEWDMVGDALAAAASTIVTFDSGYATNDTIYAASGDEIDRCEIDTDEDWGDQEWKEFDVPTTTTTATVGGDSFSVYFVAADDGCDIVEFSGAVLVTQNVGTPDIVYDAETGIWTVTAAAANDEVLVMAIGTAEPCSGTVDNTNPHVSNNDITVAEVDDADGDAVIPVGTIAFGDSGSFVLPDTAGTTTTTTVAGIQNASGLVASGDGTLYASDATVGIGVWRSLNPTADLSDVVFELVDFDLATTAALTGLRLTAGTNVLWAKDLGVKTELWSYEDFLATSVVLDEPSNNDGVPGTDEAWLKWKELNGADEYQLKYSDDEDFDVHVTTVPDIDELECLLEDLDDGETYYWKVRVQQDEPLLSRWSTVWNFTTKISAVGRTTEWMPENGAQDVILCPSFGWTRVSGATTYELELADNPDFTGATKATPSINSWVADSDLAYSTTYFWRTRALKDSVVISSWRSGAFTTMAKPAPAVEVAPAPPAPQITLPAPQVIIPAAVTPVWVWAIIGIGGALVIAVIVLVIRTRRAI